MTLHFSVDGNGQRSLWDTPRERQSGAPRERHVNIDLTPRQVRKLHPSTALQLEATIIKDNGEYHVWFGLPNDPGGWIQNAFIAGTFASFDAATTAIVNMTGVKVTRIATWRTLDSED